MNKNKYILVDRNSGEIINTCDVWDEANNKRYNLTAEIMDDEGIEKTGETIENYMEEWFDIKEAPILTQKEALESFYDSLDDKDESKQISFEEFEEKETIHTVIEQPNNGEEITEVEDGWVWRDTDNNYAFIIKY